MIDRLIFVGGLLLIAGICANGHSIGGRLAPNSDYVATWTVEDDEITFNVTGKTLGWLGFGMSPSRSMVGADLVIGGVRNGTPYLYDRHGTQNGFPPMDDKQDYELLGGTENATHTSLKFRRKLITNDPEDYQIDGTPIYLLWSMQTTDAQNENNLLMHDRSGASAFPENILAPSSTTQPSVTQRSNSLSATASVVIYSFDPDAIQYHVSLQLTSTYQVSWVFDDENITFQVVSATKGWAGLGFSDNGAMTGADIVVFWVDNNGRAVLSDRHGVENGYPPEDKHQDYTLLYAARNDTSLRAVFRRKRITCDSEDMPLTEDTIHLIYAWNDIMPVSTTQFEKHSNQGSKSVLFYQPIISDNFQPTPDMQNFDIRMEKLAVPEDTTVYMCKVVALPTTGKRHLIRFEPVIEPGNEDIVHHVTLQGCVADMSSVLHQQQNCVLKAFDEKYSKCRDNIIAVWAVGGQAVNFPPNVGLPIFETNGYPYAVIEVHYSNPKHQKGRLDSSGLRIWTTSDFRPIEAGLFTLGLTPTPEAQMIPPNVKEFTNYAHCNSKCSSFIPPEGIQVYSAMLHTHLAGRKVRVLHYRNGVQLPNLVADEHYDFNYQGDHLVVECVYTTTGRNTTLFGGLATYEEMCFVFMYFYPANLKSYVCMGFPDPAQAMNGLGPNLKSDPNNSTALFVDVNGQNMTVANYLKSQYMFGWDDQKIAQYQINVRDVDQHIMCTHIGAENKNGEYATPDDYIQKGMPTVTVPLVRDDICQQSEPRSDSQSVKSVGTFFASLFWILPTLAVMFAFY